MKMLGALAWYRICACYDCGNVPQRDPKVYQLRRRKIRHREKRTWRKELW